MQGGVMGEKETKAFEADEFHEIYIKLREWDDRAKEINSPLPSLEVYKERALNHLLRQG